MVDRTPSSPEDAPGTAPACRATYELRLLGGFELRRDGRGVETLPSAQRIVAFLALTERALPRAYVAESLWPDTTDGKAAANLRTALWRLNDDDHHVVDAGGPQLSLCPSVWVDVRAVAAAASRFRATGVAPGPELLDQVGGELLPGCWESWLVFERERLRLELIRLYEAVAGDALRHGDATLAALAALRAVEADPLREASVAVLIEAYLAGGLRADAARAFTRHAELVRTELGVDPSAALAARVGARDDAVTPPAVPSPHEPRPTRRGIAAPRRRRDVLRRGHGEPARRRRPG